MKPTMTAAGRHLGVEDPLARLPRGGQRLLAEHLLARGDAGQHELLVSRPPRRDHDGVDVRILDQILTGLVELRPG
jgi:hypothetical protein